MQLWFKKMMKILILIAAVVTVAAAGINIFMIAYAGRYIITAEQASELNADCALVLGARVWSTGPSSMLEDRLLTGIALYENGSTDRLLMSGDHGQKSYDEVNSMKRYAVDAGVPADDVFMDHAGFSTYDSVYRASAVFCVEKMIVVTQKYHLYRAIFTARMLGIEAYGVASDLRDYQGMPYNNAREALARVKDLGMALIKPQPTYLGEAIPISGSGSLTDDTDEYLNAGGTLDE